MYITHRSEISMCLPPVKDESCSLGTNCVQLLQTSYCTRVQNEQKLFICTKHTCFHLYQTLDSSSASYLKLLNYINHLTLHLHQTHYLLYHYQTQNTSSVSTVHLFICPKHTTLQFYQPHNSYAVLTTQLLICIHFLSVLNTQLCISNMFSCINHTALQLIKQTTAAGVSQSCLNKYGPTLPCEQ